MLKVGSVQSTILALSLLPSDELVRVMTYPSVDVAASDIVTVISSLYVTGYVTMLRVLASSELKFH